MKTYALDGTCRDLTLFCDTNAIESHPTFVKRNGTLQDRIEILNNSLYQKYVGLGDEKIDGSWILSIKGYTFLSRSHDRNPEQALTVQNTFNGRHNIYRLDLVYSAAATKFVLDYSRGIQGNIDINDAFKYMLKKTKPTRAISENKAKKLFSRNIPSAYLKWGKRFQADKVFKYTHSK